MAGSAVKGRGPHDRLWCGRLFRQHPAQIVLGDFGQIGQQQQQRAIRGQGAQAFADRGGHALGRARHGNAVNRQIA